KGFSFENRPSRPIDRDFEAPETRLLASIFDTLLSSQGSDAHLRRAIQARLRGNRSTVPASLLGVKFLRSSSDRRLRRAWLLADVHCTRPRGVLLRGVCPGTGLLGVWSALSRSCTAWCPFLPVGLTKKTLDRARGGRQIGMHPGRVAAP